MEPIKTLARIIIYQYAFCEHTNRLPRVHARVMDFQKHNINIYSRGHFEYLILGGTRLSESNKLTAIVVAPYYIIFLLLLCIYTLGLSPYI